MTGTTERIWTMEPFRDGAPQDFARLREMLVRNHYTASEICDRIDIKSITEFEQFREGRQLLRHLADPQALLVRLLFDAEPVAWSVVRSVLSAEDLATLEVLGLIQAAPDDESSCVGSVLLYPVEGMYIVSDRNVDPQGPVRPAPDVVYPAVTKNTHQFMAVFSRTRCADFLELCSGTGIAALVAARDFARHATAIDITERATRFARFNARLNGIENFLALQGDLYEPVRGRTFDRIVAHPPFMPSLEQQFAFRDGGVDGEEITRRIIGGLPEFLRPGGRFYCSCLASDRKGAPLEMRVREMLGDAGDEFDVAVVQGGSSPPRHYLLGCIEEGFGTMATLEARLEVFDRLGVEALIHGAIIIQRRSAERPVFTTRRQLGLRRPSGLHAEARDFEWLLRWEEVAMDPLLPGRLLDAAPRANPAVQLRQLYHPRHGDWELDRTWIDVLRPFSLEASCPYWVPALLAAADGGVTGRGLLQMLKAKEMAPEETPEEEFAAMLVRFMGAGMLDIVGCPLPGAEGWVDEGAEGGSRRIP